MQFMQIGLGVINVLKRSRPTFPEYKKFQRKLARKYVAVLSVDIPCNFIEVQGRHFEHL